MKITALALLALTSVQAFSNNPIAFVRPNQQVGRKGQAYAGRLFAETDTALSKQQKIQSDMIDKELQQLEQDLAATPEEALATPQQLKKLVHVIDMVTEHATDEDDDLRGGGSPSPTTNTFHKLPPSKQEIADIVNGLLLPKPSLEEARERAGLVQEETQGFVQSILDTQKTLLETIRTMSAADEDLGYEQYPTHPEVRSFEQHPRVFFVHIMQWIVFSRIQNTVSRHFAGRHAKDARNRIDQPSAL